MVERLRSFRSERKRKGMIEGQGINYSDIRVHQRSRMIEEALQAKIDGKTKPAGSLGRLESLAFRIGSFQNSLEPEVEPGGILVFAGDHGVSRAGASAYPREVTHQMVRNILEGGAAINCLAEAHGLDLQVIDAGVDAEFGDRDELIHAKIGRGTRDFSEGPAMTEDEFEACEKEGERIVRRSAASGYRVLGFGEMGIGNSTSAAAIMSKICGRKLDECVGIGAGSVGEAFRRKRDLLDRALSHHREADSAKEVLKAFGGFEIVQMQAAMKAAFRHDILLIVDGFISSTAFLAASREEPGIYRSAIFSHVSEEHGHSKLLEDLGGDPLLRLGMRLGEGTGAAMAYPLLRSATSFLNGMASFDSAGVSGDKA